MIVLIDNGHGYNTPGKKSVMPNGEIFEEWEYTRMLKMRLFSKMYRLGMPFEDLVPESYDIALSTRIQREHALYNKHKGDTLLLDLHGDAFSDEGANGITVFTSRGETGSDPIGSIFVEELAPLGMANRFDVDTCGNKGREADFAMVKKTKSRALLLELGFYTNRKDVERMDTSDFQEYVVDCIIRALVRTKNETPW